MKYKKRKPRPQPPPWFFMDNDNCWFCRNRNRCGGCKVLKRAVNEQKGKRKEKKQ
jgi:hypothetical protein